MIRPLLSSKDRWPISSLAATATADDDPFGWLGVEISDALREVFMTQWEMATDEQKEQMKEQWNNMTDDQKDAAIAGLEAQVQNM